MQIVQKKKMKYVQAVIGELISIVYIQRGKNAEGYYSPNSVMYSSLLAKVII